MTLDWTFDANNPVVRPGEVNGPHDANGMASGNVIRVGDRYRLYYWGRGADGSNTVCAAESPVDRPNAWRGLGSMLGAQPETDYNCGGPVIPTVVPRDDGPWLMYVGTNGKVVQKNFGWSTGAALSDDRGLTWRWATASPLVAPGPGCDRVGSGTAFVLREGSRYRMWYTCCRGQIHDGTQDRAWVGIGYAESGDGIAWRRTSDEWQVAPRGDAVQPFEWWLAKPHVMVEERGGKKRYRMWVSASGSRYRIRSLLGADGLNWQWEPDTPEQPGLSVGMPGAFDDGQRSYAGVIREGDEYRMWYTGNGYGSTGIGYATAKVDF